MPEKIQAPRGTFDILPEEHRRRVDIFVAASAVLDRAGYGRIETPIFEATELFARGVGESTDIVTKEMFTFADQGDRSLTLRPEATAAICRAYIEHGMHRLPQPVKLWCWGPFFRHERPQAGRFRQFNQLNIEAIGSDSPLVDAEAIILLDSIFGELGVPGVRLRLGSLATPDTRAAYRDELRDYLRTHESELSAEVRARIDLNPLRAFDADDGGTKAVMAEAPRLLDRLEGEDADHFAEVRGLLDQAGVAYELDGTLVRGLDYYVRTVFEFTADSLGAQSALGGGGRYDGLVAELGGPATPAIGWAAGLERILLALDEEAPSPVVNAFVVAEGEDRDTAFALVNELRQAGACAQLDLAGRSVKGQMKHADRIGAERAVIFQDGKVSLRDMASGEQQELDAAAVVEALAALRLPEGDEGEEDE